ncbi:glycoside hydrolase family 65 protein [Isoptericola sediminis]|uniref:Glycoside hydrolase family 65 protein n=1 Tax=Isoptericola sediminis TaxID=2733572 RepID=A0A849JTZ3_9MICO|nr:glycoside hydrolase family 65 protein [Isoptericola sediminis]
MSFKTPDEERTVDRQRFPAEPWRLVETRYSDEDLGTTETLFAVGNGYLGMRGNVEEGRESFAHGTFVNGFHETWPIRHAEEAYGFAKVGQTIVNVPDTKVIRLYVDDEPLLLPVADLLEYERSLDLRDGMLRRDLLWRTPSGKLVRVRSDRMVSFVERHLAVMTFEVTLLDAAAPVAISSQILNRQDGEDEYHVSSAALGEGFDPRKAEDFRGRVLQPRAQWGDDERLVLGYRCTNSGMTLAVAADDRFETENEWTVRTQVEEDLAKHVFRVQAEPGRPVRLTKTVAYHTSRGVPPRELVDRCRRTLDRAADGALAERYADQRAWLDDFWERSDVEIGGQEEIQQAVRWNLFQVAQATARSEGSGVPAKGLTGSGYGGHYFWDTEIYVLPFLTYTSPRFARNALRVRYHMLDAARRRARELSQRGALFPWRTINGEEASAYYAAGTAQYHIDADVSYALLQYARATGDTDFLHREGVDILVETARLWADLGFWRANGDHLFHIHGVTGPDEYTTVVNDNLFTNVMARFNLRAAAHVVGALRREDPEEYEHLVKRLGLEPSEPMEWARAGNRMAIPFEEGVGIHPQDSHFLEREIWDLARTPRDRRPLLLHYHPLVIYRFQVLKQADVVAAMVLQGHLFTPEQKLANFEYYDPLTTGDSTLSGVAQSIIAAEVGYHRLALEYFLSSVYVDLANLHGNAADGVHVASAGGTWAVLVSGFGGMRDHDGDLTFDPRLPRGWESLTYRLTWKGTRLRVTVLPGSIELVAETGGGVTVAVRGEEVTVRPGVPARVPLDGQGPVRHGRPGRRALAGNRRADGTLITAIVPHS